MDRVRFHIDCRSFETMEAVRSHVLQKWEEVKEFVGESCLHVETDRPLQLDSIEVDTREIRTALPEGVLPYAAALHVTIAGDYILDYIEIFVVLLMQDIRDVYDSGNARLLVPSLACEWQTVPMGSEDELFADLNHVLWAERDVEQELHEIARSSIGLVDGDSLCKPLKDVSILG